MNRGLKWMIASLLMVQPLHAQEPKRPVLTTDHGAPVGDNQNSQTAGPNGPTLLQDWNLIEKLARFDRERIPERVVHARGVGAHGVFESYDNWAKWTKASFLKEKGKKTDVFVRFSTVIHPSGSPETARDPRGFAVKFYTDEGNYDLVGNHLPVFFIRDAIKFPDMVHSLKPSPATNQQDPGRFFDFFSRTPEATHMLTSLFSDHGTPATYREMDGFGVHSFKWVNPEGKVHYVKYHWKSLQGIRNLSAVDLGKVVAQNWAHATADLYQTIAESKFPAWELRVQLLHPEDLDKFDFNPLDATKIWPESLVPSVAIGKMTLNRMPKNFFAETEQVAFSPGVLVPGIEPSEDRLLQGRLFSYADSQRYRLGANYQQIGVNRPKVEVHNYQQDGIGSTRQPLDGVNYEPNSRTDSPVEQPRARPSYMALLGFTQQSKITKTNDFQQAGDLYRSYTAAEKDHLIRNLSDALKEVKNPEVSLKMVSYFYRADAEYGERLAKQLNLNLDAVKTLAAQK